MNLLWTSCGSFVAGGLSFLALQVIIFAFNEKQFLESVKINGG
jgi:hypothetical protein